MVINGKKFSKKLIVCIMLIGVHKEPPMRKMISLLACPGLTLCLLTTCDNDQLSNSLGIPAVAKRGLIRHGTGQHAYPIQDPSGTVDACFFFVTSTI